ncbi:MAG: RNA polymerase factor sigma-54 [Deltaproteobacteria bacterium]|nr:RNA polymerase factor sigma-54 [Deltaproteobacteria bacterium]
MAGLELKQSLKLQQQLVMTPQLQQAIKLLQLSRMELVDVVRTELEENPVLEESLDISSKDKNDREMSEISLSSLPESSHQTESEPQTAEAIEASKEIDWEKYLENYANQPSIGGGKLSQSAEDTPSLEATLGQIDSLADHIMWQLHMSVVLPEEEAFVELVVGSLDKDGYLKDATVEELAAEANLDPEDAEEVLKMIQTFDPVGVASRDLRECLLAQVDALGLDIDVRQVIDKHLHYLENRNYGAIAKEMELELDDIYEVAKIISTLEPKPARNFITESPLYITPDVYVHKIGDKYFVVPNDDGMPRLKISGFFKNAMDSDQKAKEYVQNKMRSAQWLIRSIDQRRRTITRVTECIVEKQYDFFENGVQHLKPLILKDVAEAVSLHESTISRVTTNKYVQTPQGLFELKFFFSSSIKRTTEDDIASESVKNKIKDIISREDDRKPLSDQKIVNMLKDGGIVIARRTVAKYREMLGILSSSKRKKLF